MKYRVCKGTPEELSPKVKDNYVMYLVKKAKDGIWWLNNIVKPPKGYKGPYPKDPNELNALFGIPPYYFVLDKKTGKIIEEIKKTFKVSKIIKDTPEDIIFETED